MAYSVYYAGFVYEFVYTVYVSRCLFDVGVSDYPSGFGLALFLQLLQIIGGEFSLLLGLFKDLHCLNQ